MTDLLTLPEASRESAINIATLRAAIFQERLPAKKVDGYTGGQGKCKYLISLQDLDAFKEKHQPKDKRPWTDADIEALSELMDTCTTKQLSEYLERSESAISQKMWKLRITRTGACGGGSRVPFNVPYAAILLAKTCLKCGKLRDASHYRVMRKSSRENFRAFDPACYHCNIKDGRQRYRTNRDRDPNLDCNTGRLHRALQEATKDRAERDNYPYTQREIDVILDNDKSTLQVALELKRTFYAIRNQRSKFGMHDQTYSDIFPEKKKHRRNVPDSQWLIHFPKALEVLREHFQSIGDTAQWELPASEVSRQDHRPVGRKTT